MTKQLTDNLKKSVRLYSKLKRMEKRLKDKLDDAKAKLEAFLPKDKLPVGEKAEYLDGDKKVLTYAHYPGKVTTDTETLKSKYPAVFAEVEKIGKDYYQINLH